MLKKSMAMIILMILLFTQTVVFAESVLTDEPATSPTELTQTTEPTAVPEPVSEAATIEPNAPESTPIATSEPAVIPRTGCDHGADRNAGGRRFDGPCDK